jgi:ferritin
MIGMTMQQALNAQINQEQYSAQLYLAMSGHLQGLAFRGFAHWLRIQSSEETAHATRLVGFLLDRGGALKLEPVAAPPAAFGGVIPSFEQVLAHERVLTGLIGGLFELARKEKDHASEIALQWYVAEQVKEEAGVSQIVDQLHAVGDKGGGIWYLDSKLGKRGAAS